MCLVRLEVAVTNRVYQSRMASLDSRQNEGEAGSANSEETVKAATAAASNLLIKAEIEPAPKFAAETPWDVSSGIVFL